MLFKCGHAAQDPASVAEMRAGLFQGFFNIRTGPVHQQPYMFQDGLRKGLRLCTIDFKIGIPAGHRVNVFGAVIEDMKKQRNCK